MPTKVFVDGVAGTVGAALRPHLLQLQHEGIIELLGWFTVEDFPDEFRKDLTWRKNGMAQADLVVLCLPDSEAANAVALLESVNPSARILDASAVHRCHPDWTYGLPEIVAPEEIQRAVRVANPGCFATACILGGRPLAGSFGISQLVFQGVTGYSAGGRKATAENKPRLVQFGKAHRHLPEITRYTGAGASVLTTMVGPWRQGMLVQLYVNLPVSEVLRAYELAYLGSPKVSVIRAREVEHRVNPESCNGTNEVLICVAEQPAGGTSVAIVLDNLGKGSAGAAAANLRLMLTGRSN